MSLQVIGSEKKRGSGKLGPKAYRRAEGEEIPMGPGLAAFERRSGRGANTFRTIPPSRAKQ